MEGSIKAVIYARYSSDNQREESIEGQIRECTAFAEKPELLETALYTITISVCPSKRKEQNATKNQ